MNATCKIEFKCINAACATPIDFSLTEIESNGTLICPHCRKAYSFHPDFVDKMKRFYKLVEAVQDARDILGNANVAINVKGNEIKIPYRLLLTRMNTLITLKMDDGELTFRFRVEPLNDNEVIK